MNLAARHFENGIFHFDIVRKVYAKFLNSIKIPPSEPFNVMDIGCGSGRLLNEVLDPMLPDNCKSIIGTDINGNMIEFCKTNKKNSSRIEYDVLDISTKDLPDKFRNNFKFLFSSYCFMYVRDMGQALKNCNKMMTQNGELIFAFLAKKNFLYSTYRKMYEKDIWKPYTEDFKDFEPIFHGENRDAELREMFQNAKLKAVNHEFCVDLQFDLIGKQALDIYTTMDTLYFSIPDDLKQEYKRDYLETMSEFVGLDLFDEKVLRTKQKLPGPSVFIHANKIGELS